MKVAALAGGTGSAKLLRGLYALQIDLKVVANVGDNVWMYGTYVCPDIDIACYSLAGIADRSRGWGISGDTFEALSQLSRLGMETWFKLGDRDMATSLVRTQMLNFGLTLTQATARIRKSLGVKCGVLPVSDDPLETRIVTPMGNLHLQEFWVREKGLPQVSRVQYRGARGARLTPEVRRAIEGADRIVLCPANPVTSMGPMLAVPGLVHLLRSSRARVSALSPMVGRAPFSGPAGKMMRAQGIRQDSVGVAELYSEFLDSFVISDSDSDMKKEIEGLGIDCPSSDTSMKSSADEVRLAKEVLEA